MSPFGRVAEATTGAALTVSVSGALVALVLAESVALKTRPETVVALAERLPVIAPVDEFSTKLGGSGGVTDHAYGGAPPVAAKVVPT